MTTSRPYSSPASPANIKPRELYNLFLEFPGYQSSQLRGASEKNQPYGFAVFKDQHCPVAAMQALNGMVFDLSKPSTLYVNLAKSNSRSKCSRPALSGAEPATMNMSAPHVPKNNTPCPTGFVANLGLTCTEEEINQIFSRCMEFLKLKMQNKNGAPVAFVDFQDIASSTGALVNLQDCILHSSTGEGMRLEYAKSRMGMRKKSS